MILVLYDTTGYTFLYRELILIFDTTSVIRKMKGSKCLQNFFFMKVTNIQKVIRLSCQVTKIN